MQWHFRPTQGTFRSGFPDRDWELAMASRAERKTRRQEKISFQLLGLDRLKPNPANPRKHSRAQVQAIARSIEAFGFNAPMLIDKNGADYCRSRSL